MAELLLELLSEEIPARMQARAAEDLKRLVTDGLKKAGVEIDRKVLAQLALDDPKTFGELASIAKKSAA